MSPDLSETGETEPPRSTPSALVIIDVGVADGAHKGCGKFRGSILKVLRGSLKLAPQDEGMGKLCIPSS
jgi:hypothetical protein